MSHRRDIPIQLEPHMPRVIRYDMIKEHNVDSKAECDQLILAHVVRNKKL